MTLRLLQRFLDFLFLSLSLLAVFIAIGERGQICANKHEHENKLRDQNPQRGNESVFHTVYNTISQQISRFQWLPLTTMDLQCSVGCRSVLNKLCHFPFFQLMLLIDRDLQMTMKRKRLLRCEQKTWDYEPAVMGTTAFVHILLNCHCDILSPISFSTKVQHIKLLNI